MSSGSWGQFVTDGPARRNRPGSHTLGGCIDLSSCSAAFVWAMSIGFVEMTLAGKDVAEAMPLEEDHLRCCRDCRKEFEALLAVLRAFKPID
ncbi:MAG: hypothetical protein GY832_12230 [Chloroflexi bacterium]|nr:hypothetical protein [Chloroflexota bacterium]